MTKTLLETFQEQELVHKKWRDFRVGDTVRVHQRVKEVVTATKQISKTAKRALEAKGEGKTGGIIERVQIFEGVVIAKKHGLGLSGTFTVRKIAAGVGVERIFPLHSPNIEKIEVSKRSKVRRAKLYYVRGLRGKKARKKLKEQKFEELIAQEPKESVQEQKELAPGKSS